MKFTRIMVYDEKTRTLDAEYDLTKPRDTITFPDSNSKKSFFNAITCLFTPEKKVSNYGKNIVIEFDLVDKRCFVVKLTAECTTFELDGQQIKPSVFADMFKCDEMRVGLLCWNASIQRSKFQELLDILTRRKYLPANAVDFVKDLRGILKN